MSESYPAVSRLRRRAVVDALRSGTVPASGLDLLAVGTERVAPALDAELELVEQGGSVFKAIRGEYGSGKTFLTRWLAERARRRGIATAEVQISETETPLHRLETVYRRLTERLTTAESPPSALRPAVDNWFFTLEEDVLASGAADPSVDPTGFEQRVDALLEQRLAEVSRSAPQFAAALRGYRAAVAGDDPATAEGLLAWLGGEPHVAAAVKRRAGIRGDLDHTGALAFLGGLLAVLRDSGYPGLLLVLDEVETLQRVRGDVREKSLNALRQLADDVSAGRFPGLMLVLTGTPAFFDGPQGVQRLAPLAQRLHVDFTAEVRFDNPRAVQIRLPGFTADSLTEVGRKVRDLYACGSPEAERLRSLADDAYVADLAEAVAGGLGGRIGVAPRLYLKKLVDVLDRVEQFPDFDPRRDYAVQLAPAEMSATERAAAGTGRPAAAASPDDVEIDL